MYGYFIELDRLFAVTLLHRLLEGLNDLYFTFFKKKRFNNSQFLSKFKIVNLSDANEANQTRIITLAAGKGKRWGKNNLKQLTSIDGIPLIEHQLKAIPSLQIISHHYQLNSYTPLTPSIHNFVLETFLSTHSIWEDRTIILLGDVLFGKEDLAKVLSYQGDFTVFGSKSQMEIFAISFTKKVHPKVYHHIFRSLDNAYNGGRGKLWEFYHSYLHVPFNQRDPRGIKGNFIELISTTDIDSPSDLQNVLQHLPLKHYD